jgi:hypothetical protein
MMACPGTGRMIYSLEPDTPWHQVVINSVSISHSPAHADTYTALRELGEWNSWMSHALNTHKEARFLLPSGETPSAKAPDWASLKLSFADAAVASRLLREGVYMFGEHCRVSLYKRRKRSQMAAQT